MPKQEAPKRDLLEGHPRYKKLTDLNEGTFGVVMLALDQATNERVRSKHLTSLAVRFAGCQNCQAARGACPSLHEPSFGANLLQPAMRRLQSSFWKEEPALAGVFSGKC